MARLDFEEVVARYDKRLFNVMYGLTGNYHDALDLTEDGYQDAFTNLEKIYRAQERWDELHELATACGQSLKQTNGQPNSTGRAYARGVAARLEQEGKVGQ